GRDGESGYISVEWTAHGNHQRYRSAIDPDRTVIASGICLSGRDRDFDLTSLVSVTEGDGNTRMEAECARRSTPIARSSTKNATSRWRGSPISSSRFAALARWAGAWPRHWRAW